MQRFGGERIKGLMQRFGIDQDTPIENRFVTKSIGGAQVKVEGYHFDIRKHLLDFDDVLNRHREIIYRERRKVLGEATLRDNVLDNMVRTELEGLIHRYLPDKERDTWDLEGLTSELRIIFPNLPSDLSSEDRLINLSRDEIAQRLADYGEEAYADRERGIGADSMRTLERLLMLRTIDTHWVHHLTAMEGLRQGVGLQAVGQRDPLVVYKTEGHKMFQELLQRVQRDIVYTIYQVSLAPTNGSRRPSSTPASPMEAVAPKGREAVAAGGRKVGRNEPCPCGSGKKYKKCHGAEA